MGTTSSLEQSQSSWNDRGYHVQLGSTLCKQCNHISNMSFFMKLVALLKNSNMSSFRQFTEPVAESKDASYIVKRCKQITY